jgi:carbon monoxide dehydrogenase subunit G
VTHEIQVAVPLDETWAFIRDTRNWAPLMPGFRGMTQRSQTESEWRVQGDIGILSRLVTLDVHASEWVEQDHVDFTLVCREEPLRGAGTLLAAPVGETSTQLVFSLSAEAGGMLGPAVNALLGKVLPGMAREFAEAIGRAIETEWIAARTE